MDFPGGATTNIRVIDGFSTIYWRIYTEELTIASHAPEVPANGLTILKHLSRLKDLELRLRNLDCLVACLPRRLGLWVFSATPDFESLSSLYLAGNQDGSNRLHVDSSTLRVSASGNATSHDLMRNLSAEPQPPSTNNGAPQKPQAAQAPARRIDSYSGSAAIYATFVSAVTGAISLQLVRRHGAIPLGSRTLFTAVEQNGYESPQIANDDPASVPSLTTLQIQLTPIGKVIVSFQSVGQMGITRLLNVDSKATDLLNAPIGLDLWLSPNGTVARLTAVGVDRANIPSPTLSSMQGAGKDSSFITPMAKRNLWKSNVLGWLGNFGLALGSLEEELWVEVEVFDSFYARLAGESTSALPLKRFLWPARYCFRRTASDLSPSSYGASDGFSLLDDPLDFAQRWFSSVPNSIQEVIASDPSIHSEEHSQSKNQALTSPKAELSDGVESLSRTAEYPDLSTATLVYPTPPDGALSVGVNVPHGPETLHEEPTLNPPHLLNRPQGLGDPHGYPDDSAIQGLNPSSNLAIGSGLYDGDDDEDLFGEMNDKNFGSKGISDADFSFFDNPGFDDMGEDVTQSEDMLEPPKADFELEDAMPDPPSEVDSIHEMEVQSSPACPTPTAQPEPLEEASEPSPEEDRQHHDETRQTISPPLSPVEVKKILFAGEEQIGNHSTGRKQSHYDPVLFRQNLQDWNEKYGVEGKFMSAVGTAFPSEAAHTTKDIPTIGLPPRSKSLASTKDSLKIQGPSPTIARPPVRSDSVSSAGTSDSSEEVPSEAEISPVTLATLKRKRAHSDSGESAASSFGKSSVMPDQDPAMQKAGDSIFLGNFLSLLLDWSLMGYFSVSNSQISPALLRKEDQIHVAQILVDQITQSSLNHALDGRISLSDLENDSFSLRTVFEEPIFGGEIERLDLKSYVSLQESSTAPNTTTDPNTARQSTPNIQRKEPGKVAISKLPLPHLRLRRGQDFMEILPPGVAFWETFGLEPAYGPKDVSAYCIHPHIAPEAADAFLERLGLLYSRCGLGKHVRGDRCKKFEQGLGSWNVNMSGDSDYSSVMHLLMALCEELGTAFLQSPQTKENLVIYIINPFSHAVALTDICWAFWHLLQKYVSEASRQNIRQLDEIMLQVIPMDFIASSESLVVPTQSEYLSLALEVYSRCPLKDSRLSLVNATPPILLAENSPKTINFRLAAEATSPLQEAKSLHLAYSRSLDRRWITVAWSDSTGSFQRTMSYCLRFRGSTAARSLSEVRGEIWGATKTIMEKTQARWRLLIANTDPVEQEEIDVWVNLIDQYNQHRSLPLELVILNVNPVPDLHLEPPSLPLYTNILHPHTSSTPVTTPLPLPNALSPDPLGNAATTPTNSGNNPVNAATPTDGLPEPESESLLTDICDESWALILSHRLNYSPHLTEYRPALASGHLLRRKGPADNEGVFAANVNLVYTQRPYTSYDLLLREIIGMYRDLTTLARARGTRSAQRSTLPWHVATAVRAQELLSYVL
ncbi:hypothetical protein ASPZODRAFT_134172 [Penicilliopsis zonata CBS 506.65]|uniref:Mediator of RNA polymerase II transcription subunit 13 n=1 Tax=Penicilliopsis zonata CBS 506.65 TaxID=1073090 RepID=A0A1L9SEH3_9EURO|nr:hypothetical protein ASPZODRAFT_134172 [Penicilliopsis zonata CBS 506.65]OJJ45497.1 hypothetical protein ASPZODRAFT_134172 [Penicilliopsis zonata CBS 506.65]